MSWVVVFVLRDHFVTTACDRILKWGMIEPALILTLGGEERFTPQPGGESL